MGERVQFFHLEMQLAENIEWYKAHFKGKARVYGESSPTYTYHPHFFGVPARMRPIVPNAKLIYILRDPTKRSISQYVPFYAERRENTEISEALAYPESNPYICRNRNLWQSGQYLKYFPESIS